MSCKITVTNRFLRELKRLAKKYRSIKEDVYNLGQELQDTPLQGIDLGRNLRKVRMAISSKGKGKSGGARVITYTVLIASYDAEIKLLTIYDKSEKENITDAELLEIMKENGLL